MLPKIKNISALSNYKLKVIFEDDKTVIYDVLDDIITLPDFVPLKTQTGLFENFQIDESKTCVSWSDRIDLPSDILYEYGESLDVA